MSKIKVARLEPYPSQDPLGWVVGFNVNVEGMSFYEVTTVTFEESKSEEEAVDVAYEKLKNIIDSKADEIRGTSSLLGKTYQPKQ